MENLRKIRIKSRDSGKVRVHHKSLKKKEKKKNSMPGSKITIKVTIVIESIALVVHYSFLKPRAQTTM